MKNSINTKRFVEKLQESAFTYTLISIIIGFIVGAIALLIAGYNPIESYGKLFGVIFRSTKNISYSFIEYSVPYILTGLSVAFAFKTGVFNIGAEGQYVMGSVAAMLVGAFVKAPAYINIPLCIVLDNLWPNCSHEIADKLGYGSLDLKCNSTGSINYGTEKDI